MLLRGSSSRKPDSAEIALFRVLQESLTDVHRHSGSEKTEIRCTSLTSK